ncbi:MAG: phosphoglycerate dehydrogenase [Acidobacteriota bacterium]
MKVLVTDRLGEPGLEQLRNASDLQLEIATGLPEDELCKTIADADALIIRSGTTVTRRLLEAAGQLKVIGRAGIGVDNVDVPAATERGVVVMNTPDANATTTAELAIAHLFSLCRRLPQADASVRAGKWERSAFVGAELTGKTLGIVGFGTIGRIVARRARGLRMIVLASDPVVTEDVVRQEGAEPLPLDELLKRCDILTLHCPLIESTRGLIGADQIASMKKGARIVNCARGGLIDEAALLAALDSGQLAGAALDVYENEPPEGSPLLSRDDIVFTPHVGASTKEAQAAVAEAIASQVIDFLQQGEIRHAVNLPSMPAELAAKLEPWLGLAGSLGRLLSQIAPGPLEAIELATHGTAAELDLRTLTSETLAGLLQSHFDTPVNRVNSTHLAKERGLSVTQVRSDDASDHVGLMRVTGRTADGATTTLSGALLGGRHPRLVEVDGYRLEATPEGHLLMTRHQDKPGVIGALGSLLGESGINISRMSLGVRDEGGDALALLSISDAMSAETLDRVRGIEAIEQAWSLKP